MSSHFSPHVITSRSPDPASSTIAHPDIIRRLVADLHHNSQQGVNLQALGADFGCHWSYSTSADPAWPNALVEYDQWHPRFGGDP